MEIIVKAKTEKAGNFMMKFEDYENLKKFLTEVLKHLQFAELQKIVLESSNSRLFADVNEHYKLNFERLNKMCNFCKYRFYDFAVKNIFEVERKS